MQATFLFQPLNQKLAPVCGYGARAFLPLNYAESTREYERKSAMLQFTVGLNPPQDGNELHINCVGWQNN